MVRFSGYPQYDLSELSVSPLPSPLSGSLRARALAVLLAFCMPPAAQAALRFDDVTAQTGIDFVSVYGPVFDESGNPPEFGCAGGTEDTLYMQRNMGNGVAVGDYDRDGDLDVYLTANAGSRNRLYRNELYTTDEDADELFVEVTAQAFGLGSADEHDVGLSRVAHFVDLDNDTWLDLLVVNDDDVAVAPGHPMYGPSRIYQNQGDGTFVDVTEGSGFRPHGYVRGGASLADYDGDGLLDIFTTVWVGFGQQNKPVFPGTNQLFRNLGNFTFQDVSDIIPPQDCEGHPRCDSFSAIFHDFDEDHVPEIFVAVDHTDDFFYRWQDDRYVDRTNEVGIFHKGNDMGIAAADYDDDGDLDMYVTNIYRELFGGFRLNNVLWENTLADDDDQLNGTLRFVDRAVDLGADDTYWGWGTQFVDLDNDTDLDLVAANGFDAFEEYCDIGNGEPVEAYHYDRPTVLLESLWADDGQRGFERNASTVMEQLRDDSRALVAFDYDRDGDQDVLVTNVEESIRMFENTTRPKDDWLDVALAPSFCAVGATVRATVGDLVMRRDVIAGRSYLAGTPEEVHFGLGDAEHVDVLEIEWADGSTEVMIDVEGRQLVEVACVPLPEPDGGLLGLSALLALLGVRGVSARGAARRSRPALP